MATDPLTCEILITAIGLRRFSLPALLMILCVSASMTFAADAMSQSTDFDIAPQPVESALHEWSRQSNVQVMVASSEVFGQRTNGVKGRLTAASALTQLLKPTNLTYETVGSNTVAVRRVAAAMPTEQKKTLPRQAGLDDEITTPRESDSSKRRSVLEEIVVTAQKREERLEDVPISISVLTGMELDKSTVEGVTEALTHVPGVAVNVTNQGGGTQLVIRGVAAGGALFAGSSPVSYYLDSVPFSLVRQAIVPDSNAYDLERVEVLRGPQGTLYGASAQNGVVRVLTNDADFDAFELKARVLTSNSKDGGWNYRGDMAVNAPIVEGKLAARAVLGYQDLSGWIDRPNKEDANDAEIGNVRLKVNGLLTDQFSIGLSAWRSRADYGGPSISDDEGRRDATFDEPMSTDFDAYGAKLGYELPLVSVASMTSYLDYENDGFQDVNPLVPGLLGETILNANVFSQELVLTSKQEGPWRWSLGGMYRDAEDRQRNIASFPSLNIVSVLIDQTYVSKSFAVFGEVTRRFFDGQLELTGGLRYFEDDVDATENALNIRSSDTFDALSPRAVLTWYPSENVTIYGSYAEGFRSGFPQQGSVAAVAPQFPPTDADTLHNYELGAKSDLWGGRITFETALYYIDWQDVQQSLTVPLPPSGLPFVVGVNSQSASGVGFDVGITTRPVEGLSLGINFSWNDLTMDGEVFSAGSLLFDKGDRLNVSPEYMVGAWADYIFPLGGTGFKGRLSASGNYTSEMDVRTIESGTQSIAFGDSILIGRTSLAVDAPNNWSATLFVDNVTNEQGSPARFPFFRPLLLWDTRVRPRTMGVQFDFHFQ